jgi:acyl-[acyl-carrier-protein]-phospholipid O-acyltransferase/long-chain-fatty-acid--[acyl-carrier-protein] ligase
MREKNLLKPILTFLLNLLFRVEIIGLEHYRAAGDKVIIAANHQSFIDPLLLGALLPDIPRFAINIFQAEKFYIYWMERYVKLYRLDPSKPMSMKSLIQDLRHNTKVVIFPEGRITTSGGIMKIYEGTGMVIEKTGATVLPVRIERADFSKLSRLSRKLRQRWFPKIRMTILPPVRFEQGTPVSPRIIYDLMTQAVVDSSNYHRPLLSALLEAAEWHGGNHAIASDFTRVNMTYKQLFTRCFILRDKLKQDLPDQYVGVMLPTGFAALVTFFSLHMLNKIPCMLNFSAGSANITHACRIAKVKTVLTSREFVEKGKLEPVIEALQKECEIIYLEDIRKTITSRDKLLGLGRALFARDNVSEALSATKPHAPAVILYTSGSEGVPKGVALSHINILVNMQQAVSRLDLLPTDILFNAMPVFHSFGLAIGMLLPVLQGIKVFLYPTPLHYRVIPDLIYDTDATIMLGTDTFYNGYAHYAHPYDFWNIRLAVAGAEKLKASTRQLYAEKFGVRIMEGYGVTEASPIVSVNTPMENQAGTVGRPLPGIQCKLVPVEGIAKGGRLFIKGANIMLGYLKADQPGVVQPQDEWYDTGDIVDINDDGFIHILGRAKRFAKIGGEMVSLVVPEELAQYIAPDVCHAAVSIPDDRKGEQIILFTESSTLTREQLVQEARTQGIAEISVPRSVIFLESIPRLGNGKIDYVSLSKMGAPKTQIAI